MTESRKEPDRKRTRIDVPPGDPFTRETSRIQAQRRDEQQGASSREQRRSRMATAWQRDPEKMNRVRKRMMVINFLFFGVAVVVFFVIRFTAPKIIVQTGGVPGDVWVDDELVGRSHKLIRQLPPGYHVVRFSPDNTLVMVTPESVAVDLYYGLEVEKLAFVVTEMPPDSLPAKTPGMPKPIH